MVSPHNKHGFAGVFTKRHTPVFYGKLMCDRQIYYFTADTAEAVAALYDAKAYELGVYNKIYKNLHGVFPPDYVEKEKEKQHRPNRYGFPGICFDAAKNRFRARVRRNGKTYKLYSRTLEEAIENQKYLNEKHDKPKKVNKHKEIRAKNNKVIYTDEEYALQLKKRARQSYLSNKEENLRKRKEARALDPEGFSKRTREWYANSPDARNKAVAQAAKRRAEKISATPPWASNVGKVYAEMRAIAKELESLTKIVYNVDHVVPLLAGTTTMHKMRLACGLHCEDNLELITKEENLSKQHLTWPDMWDYTDEHLVELKVLYERHTT